MELFRWVLSIASATGSKMPWNFQPSSRFNCQRRCQADGPDLMFRDIKAQCNRRELAVKHLGEAQQLVALPLEGDADFGRIQMLPLGQFVDDEVEEFAPVIKAGAGQRQDLPFQPADQGFDILGEAPLDGFVVACLRQCRRQGFSLGPNSTFCTAEGGG